MYDEKANLEARIAGGKREAGEIARESSEILSAASGSAKKVLSWMNMADIVITIVAVLAVLASIWRLDYIVLPPIGIGMALCYAAARIAVVESKAERSRISVPRVRGSANIREQDCVVFAPIDIAEGESWGDWKN